MAIFKISLSDEEYTVIRLASMKGKFCHDFIREGRSVKIKTRTPNLLAEELEELLDSGETSWKEILGIL